MSEVQGIEEEKIVEKLILDRFDENNEDRKKRQGIQEDLFV